MLKYQYIYFNSEDNKRRKESDGYYTICVADLEKLDNVHVISYPLDDKPYIIRLLYSIHNSYRINKAIRLPLKNIWFPYYFRTELKQEDDICFIVSGDYLSVAYLRYLKKKYPKAKFVKIHRDLIHIWQKRPLHYSDDQIKEIFDLRMTYDKYDAERYQLPYFTEIESKIDIPVCESYPIADVFFAGYAKDRLSKIMKVYEKLRDAGLTCKFFLVGVPEKERKILSDIEYAKNPMTYREMLYYSVNSRCILEINQENAVGYTSRFLEAVMYNKKLITNNMEIRNTKFYNPAYIQCIDEIDDLDTDFVLADAGEIDYKYCDEFSPIRLIEQIESLLCMNV